MVNTVVTAHRAWPVGERKSHSGKLKGGHTGRSRLNFRFVEL